MQLGEEPVVIESSPSAGKGGLGCAREIMKYGTCLESSGQFLDSPENFSGPRSQLSN